MIDRVARTFAAQLMTLGLALVDRILVSGLLVRFWDVERFGEWTLLLSMAGLIFLFEAGLNIHYGNAWQRMAAHRETASVERLVRVALAIGLGQGLVLSVAVVAFSVFAPFSGNGRMVLMLLGLSSVAGVMRGSISQLYRLDGAFARATMVAMMPTLGTALGGVVTVLAGGGATMLACLHLAAQFFVGWGVLFLDLKRRYPNLVFRPTRPERAELSAILHGVKWLAPQQMAPVVWTQVPVLLLGVLGVGGAPLAGFVLMRTLVGFSRQIVTMASQAAGLEFASMQHRNEALGLVTGLFAVTRLVCVGMGASCAALIVFGPSLLLHWTADADLFDPLVMGWLAAGALASAVAAPLANLMTYAGQPRAATLALAAQICASLALAALLVPSQGVVGMAAGLAIGEAVGTLVLLKQRPREAVWHPLAAGLCSAAWCFTAGLAVTHLMPTGTVMGLILALLLWGLIGPLPLLWLALPLQPFSAARRIRRSIRPAMVRNALESADS